MTPDQCRELAEHDEHMADWCWQKAERSFGLVSAGWESSSEMYAESARYWREKAGE